jgi:hypothetical protein
MNTLSTLKDYIIIDDVKYWHYGFGGKWTATKWIVWDGIHWYNSNKPLPEERI